MSKPPMRSVYKMSVALSQGNTPVDMRITNMDMVWGLVSVTQKLILGIHCAEKATLYPEPPGFFSTSR